MSALPLLARLGEAASFPKAVRAYESDPWAYMRRKLGECEGPLRDYKRVLFEQACAGLRRDLKDSFLKPGSVMEHKEAFDKLLAPADYADLSFHLAPGGDPAARREGIEAVLTAAKPKTLFDVEKLPPERRGKPWEALVAETSRRLRLDDLKALLERGEKTERRRAYIVRRLRRNLGEFLAVARREEGLRDDVTLFVLTRLEAAIAASLRFLAN